MLARILRELSLPLQLTTARQIAGQRSEQQGNGA